LDVFDDRAFEGEIQAKFVRFITKSNFFNVEEDSPD